MKKIIDWIKSLFTLSAAKVNLSKRPLTDDEYMELRSARFKKLDKILDKISKSGVDSLSQHEKNFLDNFKG